MENLTHWKKVIGESKYLGAADFQPQEEKTYTIHHVVSAEEIKTDKGKESKAVLYFSEQNSKPLILNATNSKTISQICDTPYLEQWTGRRITLFSQTGVQAFGKVVDAVRIRPYKPREICTSCGQKLTEFMGKPADSYASYSLGHYGRLICGQCLKKVKEEQQNGANQQQLPQPGIQPSDHEHQPV